MDYDIYNISDLTSRSYFEDVMQAYYSKNYRSSILLLHSLVINDLYKKLIYTNDNGPYKIDSELETIKSMSQEKEVKYSEIEKKIYNIYKDKKILNKTTFDMIDYLISVRDKCAHPIFSGEDEYYSPTMDETRMLINRSYKDILTVDAFIKDPYSVLKNSLETVEWNLYDKELFGYNENTDNILKFEKHFEKKYFCKMTDNNYIKLFKSLIDLIFRKNNEDSIKYQYIRFKLLSSLLKYMSKLGKLDLLKNTYNWDSIGIETIFDSFPIDVESCSSLTYLLKFLLYYPIFIKEIKDRNELLYSHLKEEVDNNVWQLIKYYSIFYDNIELAVKEGESYNYYKAIFDKYSDKMEDSFFIKILMTLFKNIPEFNGYDKASEMCDILINNIDKRNLTTDDISEILVIMNDNRQIYDASRNSSREQFSKMNKLGIDLSEYENLGSE